jgi:hypothetical protein
LSDGLTGRSTTIGSSGITLMEKLNLICALHLLTRHAAIIKIGKNKKAAFFMFLQGLHYAKLQANITVKNLTKESKKIYIAELGYNRL